MLLFFQVLYCLLGCICCCCRKKKNTKDYIPPEKGSGSRPSPYPDSGVENLATSGRTLATSGQNLPNYQSIARPYNFGGTADLYQNVTPPSYNSVVDTGSRNNGTGSSNDTTGSEQRRPLIHV